MLQAEGMLRANKGPGTGWGMEAERRPEWQGSHIFLHTGLPPRPWGPAWPSGPYWLSQDLYGTNFSVLFLMQYVFVKWEFGANSLPYLEPSVVKFSTYPK